VEYKKALLGAASILALTAAVETPADASVERQQDQQVVRSSRAEVAADIASDPLFELLSRTNGSVTEEAIEGAIQQIFAAPSSEQLRKLPEFLNGIATLGASANTLERAKEALLAVVASADINDATRESLNSRLESGTRPVQLAQVRRRDPQSTGTTGRDPGTTGQVGGGGGYQ
jgi:hypothetical protein